MVAENMLIYVDIINFNLKIKSLDVQAKLESHVIVH